MDNRFEPQSSSSVPEHRHEQRDVSSRALILTMIAVLIIGAILHGVIAGITIYFAMRHRKEFAPPSALSLIQQTPPEPRLQMSPEKDLAQMIVKEQELVNSYGWVDRKAGLVRIPVDQALNLVAQRGLPPKVIDTTTTGITNTSSDIRNMLSGPR
jgi:hypothetical protein